MSKLPETDSSLVRYLTQQKRVALRQAQSSAFTRSGVSVTAAGETTINGTLVQQAASIGNDILVSPIKPQAIYDHTFGFALSAFATTIRTTSVPVPVGFTSAAVMATSRVYAVNSTSNPDRIVTFTTIAGIGADTLPSDLVPASGKGNCISPMTNTVTGLTPGGTLAITVAGGSYLADWAADASNTLEVTALILWLR